MARPDFAWRSNLPELMDTEPCDFETFRDCLVDLAKVNRLTLAHRPTLSFLDDLATSGALPKERPLRILDAGSGYGDMLREIAHWADRKAVRVELIGVDLNPFSARAAREATPAGTPIEWRSQNIFETNETPVDIVLSSLFAHHLGDEALIRFVGWMENRAELGWFVNDLHRHPMPYWFFTGASRALRFHRFVQNDGPISIARSFNRADWERTLRAAGIEGASIRWWMPFRLCVSRRKR